MNRPPWLQLQRQLLQLRIESLKKNQACARNEPMASVIPVQRSSQYGWWYPTNKRERKVSTPSTSKEQKTNSHVNSHVTSIWNIRGMSFTQLSSNPEYIKVPSSRHYLTTDSGILFPIQWKPSWGLISSVALFLRAYVRKIYVRKWSRGNSWKVARKV